MNFGITINTTLDKTKKIMSLTDFLNSYPVLSFSLGLFAGAIVGAIGLYLAHRELDKKRQREKIKGFYQGLYEELKAIRNAYDMDVTIHWEGVEKNRESILWANISLTQDYSTLYYANANLIGQVPNFKLRRRVVKAYTSLKVLVDYYKQNNRALDEHKRLLDEHKRLLDKLSKLLDKRKKESEEAESIVKIMQYEHMLANFTQLLQKRHHRFLRLNEILLKTLKKELSKTNERFWEQQ